MCACVSEWGVKHLVVIALTGTLEFLCMCVFLDAGVFGQSRSKCLHMYSVMEKNPKASQGLEVCISRKTCCIFFNVPQCLHILESPFVRYTNSIFKRPIIWVFGHANI